MSTLSTMPFLSADDRILHQDRPDFDETAYWPDMDEQSSAQQTLLDPNYINPESIMSASEALMRLSEQDLNIEPSLRSLNVDDSIISFPAAGTANNNLDPTALDLAALTTNPCLTNNTQVQHAAPRGPFTGHHIRQWTEQFSLAKTHAHRWQDSNQAMGPPVSITRHGATPAGRSNDVEPNPRLLSKAGEKARRHDRNSSRLTQ